GGMDSDARSSFMEACDREEKGTRKITISDQINSLQYTNVKSDSFVVDMERFSHVTSRDVTPNSRITRSFSRKGSQRAAEKKMSASGDSERETSGVVATSSPRAYSSKLERNDQFLIVNNGAKVYGLVLERVIKGSQDSISTAKALRAAFLGVGTPEKPMVVTVGPTDHPTNPQVQHQITIVTGNAGTTTPTGGNRYGNRKFSFGRSSSSWSIDPRRILLIFATLSSMGTILLIYFTLSMGKLGEDDNALN
ncbi:hypothetical protein RJ639_032595, partial [Escallonia herrerae]